MSWLYRLIKRQPNSDTSRTEGEIQFQGISNFDFDSNTTTATVKTLTTLDLKNVTKLNIATSTATVLWATNNISIMTGTATPWNATGVTAGKGSIYLSSTGGSMYIKNTTAATTGWILVTAS
jgi:hypothetical protein